MDSSSNIADTPDTTDTSANEIYNSSTSYLGGLLNELPAVPTLPPSRQIPMNQLLPINSALDNSINEEYLEFFRSLFSNENSVLNNIPYNRWSNFRNDTSINNILNMSLNDPEQHIYKDVINKKGEETIKIMKYDKEEFKDQEMCIITLNNFNEGDEIAQLPCGHIFDKDGIFKWLKTEDARCPICREKLPSKQINKKNKTSTINTGTNTTENTTTTNTTTTTTLTIDTTTTPPTTPPTPPEQALLTPSTSDSVPELEETWTPPSNATSQLPTSQPPPLELPTSQPPLLLNRRRLSNAQLINSFINLRLQREEEQDIQDAILASLRD